MKPRDRNVHTHRSNKPAPAKAPASAPVPPPPGPRALLHARNSATALTPPPGPQPSTSVARRATGVRRSRPATGKRGRARRANRARNRRRVNWTMLLVRVAALVLIGECAAALAWSPRLYVRKIEVTGNTTVPTEELTAKLGIGPKSNILWLGTGKMRGRVASVPTVESAEIHRTLPGTVRLVVRERTPWACVRDESTGTCYTIDRNLIPFRTAESREAGLPLIVLKAGALGGGTAGEVALGAAWKAREVEEAARCLAWAQERRDAFPLEKVVVDAGGKLCLNRVGGVEVRLGSGLDLDRKLETFALLLARRTELQGAAESQIAAVNLYAYDAPALLTRPGAGTERRQDSLSR